jgi:Raf kinase inhibitor-like YbhB/YbcL family protein
MNMNRVSLFLLLFLIAGGCKMNAQLSHQSDTSHATATATAATITISSPAFQNGSSIPVRYTCQGENISPALTWSAAPGAKSYALVCEDPDAPHGTFIHWVIYNIPPSEKGLAENIPQLATLPNGMKQGMNGANKVGYMGPCPPTGKPHRYYFRLYAVGETLNLSGDVTRDLLMAAIQGHIVGMGELMGTYQRN